MDIKKALSIAVTLLLSGAALSPAYAQVQTQQNTVKPAVIRPNTGGPGYNTTSNKMIRVQEKMDTMETRQISRSGDLKSRADTEISRRVTTLQSLINKINLFKKLTADQKAALTSKIQNEISSLNTLKMKIDGDADEATLKADVKSIVQSYRVYLFFVPQINELAAVNKIITISDDYTILFDQIQTKLQDMKSKGTDTSAAEAALADAKAKTSDAKTQANKAISALETLTPEGYPGNKATLMEVRTMIKIAMTDLETARQDVKKVISNLGNATPAMTITTMPSSGASPVPSSASVSATP